MMKRIKLYGSVVALVAAVAVSSGAQAANEWGIDGEEKARIEAKVVDIACELTGNCPADCGAGKRQLGLLKDDGTLYITPKNFDIFAGTAEDLLPNCNKRIVADGLLIKTKHMPMFVVQFTRTVTPGQEKGKWVRASAFKKNWETANPGKKGNQWFRHDARIKTEVARRGELGIPGLKLKKEE